MLNRGFFARIFAVAAIALPLNATENQYAVYIPVSSIKSGIKLVNVPHFAISDRLNVTDSKYISVAILSERPAPTKQMMLEMSKVTFKGQQVVLTAPGGIMLAEAFSPEEFQNRFPFVIIDTLEKLQMYGIAGSEKQ